MAEELSFLGGETPAEQTAAPAPEQVSETPPVVETAEPTPGQPRAPDGKFASQTPPEPEPFAQAPAPVAAEPPPPAHVPISALMDERDKRKAAEDRLRAFESQRQSAPAPDRYEDPEGYEVFREQQIEARLEDQRLDMSERFARQTLGAEVVDQAKAWAVEKFQQDPLFHQQVLRQPDPYGFAVEQFRREQMFSQVQPDDFAAFLAWKAAGSQVQQPAAPAAPPIPSRSQASQPSASGGVTHEPIGPGQAFKSLFNP